MVPRRGGEAFIGITDFATEPVGRHRIRRCSDRSAKPCPPVTSSARSSREDRERRFHSRRAEVLEFNPAVDADPSIVNRDPTERVGSSK